ncbi:MAG: DUF4065 domain-containing protein [Lachnospiraceae bacterium]|nr:DUF4065 domain-containing protein [Lachnospiraceae bacterium]
MEKTMCVAKALYDMYYDMEGVCMDEMKMHKLMYFSQREALMYRKEPLFDAKFYGWKYGPVLNEVRSEYKNENYFGSVKGTVTEETKELLKSVLERYGSLSSWKLSCLSHQEFSWKKARKGLAASDNGNVEMMLESMKVDATRELVARKAATV